MTIEAMKQALEALETLARYENPETKIQVRKPKDGGPIVTMYPHKVALDAAQSLRQAIEQAEKQEPAFWYYTLVVESQVVNEAFTTVNWDTRFEPFGRHGIDHGGDVTKEPLYTAPQPQREWVGLTDEERMDILLNLNWDKKLSHMDTALAIEAKLKEKNT